MGNQKLDNFLDNGWYSEGSNSEYDDCWLNGNYEDQYCPCCPYKDECSGYEDDD